MFGLSAVKTEFLFGDYYPAIFYTFYGLALTSFMTLFLTVNTSTLFTDSH